MEVPKQLVFTHVENAIKHGLRPKEGEKKLWIKVDKLPNGIEIRVEDDGVGFEHGDGNGGTGRGIRIGREMIKLYERLRKERLNLVIENIKFEGTSVKVLITHEKRSPDSGILSGLNAIKI
ncbi:MAG: hypothetical protein U5L96_09900 [Owenweeksia sp.]|nr:hypothetical protein [Owenweeksia sp.]